MRTYRYLHDFLGGQNHLTMLDAITDHRRREVALKELGMTELAEKRAWAR